jgi:hypothetical protein
MGMRSNYVIGGCVGFEVSVFSRMIGYVVQLIKTIIMITSETTVVISIPRRLVESKWKCKQFGDVRG